MESVEEVKGEYDDSSENNTNENHDSFEQSKENIGNFGRKHCFNINFMEKFETLGECSICFQFMLKKNLSRHKRIQHSITTDQQLFPCPAHQCASVFRNKDYLKDHLRRKHNFDKEHTNELMIAMNLETELEKRKKCMKSKATRIQEQTQSSSSKSPAGCAGSPSGDKLMPTVVNEAKNKCELTKVYSHVLKQRKLASSVYFAHSVKKSLMNKMELDDELKSPEKQSMKCDICYAVLQRSTFNRHYREMHTACPRIQCTMCRASFKRKAQFKMHLKNSHGYKILNAIQEPTCITYVLQKEVVVNIKAEDICVHGYAGNWSTHTLKY